MSDLDIEKEFNLPVHVTEFNLINRSGLWAWFLSCWKVYKLRYIVTFKIKFLKTFFQRLLTTYRSYQMLNLSVLNPVYYNWWINWWTVSRTTVRNIEFFENYLRAKHIFDRESAEDIRRITLFCNLTFWTLYVIAYNFFYLCSSMIVSSDNDIGSVFLFVSVCVLTQWRNILSQLYLYQLESDHQVLKVSEFRSVLFLITQCVGLTLLVRYNNWLGSYMRLFTLTGIWIFLIETLEWYYSQLIYQPGSIGNIWRDYIGGLRLLFDISGGFKTKVSAFLIPCVNKAFPTVVSNWFSMIALRRLEQKDYLTGHRFAANNFYFYYNVLTCFDDPIYLATDYIVSSFNSNCMCNELIYHRLLNIIDMHYWAFVCQLPLILVYYLWPYRVSLLMLRLDSFFTTEKQFNYKKIIAGKDIVRMTTRNYLIADIVDLVNYPLIQIASNWDPNVLHFQIMINMFLDSLSFIFSRLWFSDSLYAVQLFDRITHSLVDFIVLVRLYRGRRYLKKKMYRRIFRKVIPVLIVSLLIQFFFLYYNYEFM